MRKADVVVLAVALVACASGCRDSKPPPAGAPAPAPKKRATPRPIRPLAEEIVHCVNTEVAAGFAAESDIVESCSDAGEDEGDGNAAVDGRWLAQLVARVLEKHRSEELGWPARTDCDRLDAAFARMEKEGIVARQNFSDCGTCGAAEIEEEADALIAAGTKVKGYAFYHLQDTEGAVEGSDLYLSYGAIGVTRSDAPSLKVGHRVLALLKEQGLRAEWNGKLARRIGIHGLKWQRRRFTRAAPSSAGRAGSRAGREAR